MSEAAARGTGPAAGGAGRVRFGPVWVDALTFDGALLALWERKKELLRRLEELN